MDNPPQRYSLWISTGQFGGSVIHRYSPVDDVDIHHQIYWPTGEPGRETFQSCAHFISEQRSAFPSNSRSTWMVWPISNVESVCSLTVEFGKITMPCCLGRSRLANSGCELLDHIPQEGMHHLRDLGPTTQCSWAFQDEDLSQTWPSRICESDPQLATY